MLKRSAYVLLSLLLCVPLVFIVYFSLSANTEKPLDNSLVRIDLQNRDGYDFSFSDKEELDLYYNAIMGAEKIDHPVRDLTGDTPCAVVYNELDNAYSFIWQPTRTSAIPKTAPARSSVWTRKMRRRF